MAHLPARGPKLEGAKQPVKTPAWESHQPSRRRLGGGEMDKGDVKRAGN
jgi:hypothetical protein